MMTAKDVNVVLTVLVIMLLFACTGLLVTLGTYCGG